MALDTNLDAIIVGTTGSDDFPITQNAFYKTWCCGEVCAVKIRTRMFDPWLDGFSFPNSKSFFDPSRCKNDSLETYRDIIISNPNWYNIFVNELINPSIYPLIPWMYLEYEERHKAGHCFGMSDLAKEFWYNPSLVPNDKTVYKLGLDDYIDEQHTLYQEIDIHQEYQNFNPYVFIKSVFLQYDMLNNAHELELIKNHLEIGPTLIGLKGEGGCHEVLGYSYDSTNRNLMIYDPNDNYYSLLYPSERKFIHFENDFSFNYDKNNKFTRLSCDEEKSGNLVDQFYQLIYEALFFKTDCPLTMSVFNSK